MSKLIIYREDSKTFALKRGKGFKLPEIDFQDNSEPTQEIRDQLGFYVEFSDLTPKDLMIARRTFGPIITSSKWIDVVEAAKIIGRPAEEIKQLVELDIKHWQEKLLETIGEVFMQFNSVGIDIVLFGGWAADFLAGKVTRPHVDIDTFIWLKDKEKARNLIRRIGYHIKDKSKKFQNERKDGKSFDVYFLDPANKEPDIMGNINTADMITDSVEATLNGITARIINPGIFEEMLKRKVEYNRSHQAELSGPIDKTVHDLKLVEEYLNERMSSLK